MITSRAFAGKRYAVLGLARSGLATVDALLASGAQVVAWDDRPEARAAVRAAHPGAVDAALGVADFMGFDTLLGFEAIIVSPGVPLNRHPLSDRARAERIPVIGDIELFAQARRDLPPHVVIGITGTNGKSTTTSLTRHIFETADVPVLMGGNIGLPILGRDPLTPNATAIGVYVLELSSYQIDLTVSLDCDVSVLLNITPDHLDRYAGFDAYAASKARLFAMQSSSHWAVLVGEDAASLAIAEAEFRRRREPLKMIRARPIDPAQQSLWPALQGPHNAQNAAAAITVARALDIADVDIDRALATYPGLPHRMERIGEKAGVLYVNDSKATNATSTAPALAAYPRIHWILGGRPKTDELDACAPQFDHVVAGYTIGEAGPLFARLLRAAGRPVTESGTLDQAVRDAAAAARPGDVVLLSPACASFDQFSDYEARGAAFRAAVEAL